MKNLIDAPTNSAQNHVVTHENVKIRDKIFQEHKTKKNGVHLRSAIPHSIPQKTLWIIMRKITRNMYNRTETL